MSASLRSGVLVCLLVTFWAVAQASAGQEEVPADLTSRLGGTLELLWEFVSQAVRTEVETPVTELGGRLDSVQIRLEDTQRLVESRVETAQEQIQSELGNVQSHLEYQLDEAEAQIKANVESKLDTLKLQLQSQLESIQSQLDSNLTNVQRQIQSSLESQLESTLESRIGRLDIFSSARDCSDLPAGARTGVHLVQPGLRQPVPAFCDMDSDGGNWTVIQRRADIQPRQDFFQGWEAYKWGLGQLDGEFWWGLEHIWLMTSLLDRRYELRIDMEDFDGEKRHALYQGFRVASEGDGYRLTVKNYTGDAGDSLSGHSGHRFSTKDRDQDVYSGNCANAYKGGWWYTKCHGSNLNGLYHAGEHGSYADGVNWQTWRGYHYSLKNVEMKIRPVKKL